MDSNDVLIRTRKRPVTSADGTIRHVGVGKHTIDRAEIERTFAERKIDVDLSNLARLAEIRNDIEHMAPQVGPTLIQEAIADAMPIIRTIVVNELREEPSTLLGEDAWETMLKQAAVFSQEQEACRRTFADIDWASEALTRASKAFQCPDCGSTLLRNYNEAARRFDDLLLSCSKCTEIAESVVVFESGLEREFANDEYQALKEGVSSALGSCPECRRHTFVSAEDRCAACGFTLDAFSCDVCGTPLSLDDYRIGPGNLCSYHFYTGIKDD